MINMITTLLITLITKMVKTEVQARMELGSRIQLPYSKKPYLRDIREYVKTLDGNLFDVTSTLSMADKGDPVRFVDDRTRVFEKNVSFVNFAKFEKNNLSRYSFGVVLTGDGTGGCQVANYQFYNISKSCSKVRNITDQNGEKVKDIVYGKNMLGNDTLMTVFVQYASGKFLVEDMKKIAYKAGKQVLVRYEHIRSMVYKPGGATELRNMNDIKITRMAMRNDSMLVFGKDWELNKLHSYLYYSNQNSSNFKIFSSLSFTDNAPIHDYDIMQVQSTGYIVVLSNNGMNKSELFFLNFNTSRAEVKSLATLKGSMRKMECRWPRVETFYHFECVYLTPSLDKKVMHLHAHFDKNKTSVVELTQDAYSYPDNFEISNFYLTRNLIIASASLGNGTVYELVWPKRQGSYNGNGYTLKMRQIGDNICGGSRVVNPTDYQDDALYSVQGGNGEGVVRESVDILSINRTGCIYLNFSFDESKDRMVQLEGRSFRMALDPRNPGLVFELTKENFKIFKVRQVKNWLVSLGLSTTLATVLLVLTVYCYKRCLVRLEELRKRRIQEMEERRRRAIQRANEALLGNELMPGSQEEDNEEEKTEDSEEEQGLNFRGGD